MSMLSTSYDSHEFGRWDEWCHELMASVLPMDDPRMSVDDLSSPTWSIIFLKDDCFLQPSCEMNSSPCSNPDSLASSTTAIQHHHYEEEMDSTIPSSPSSAIEPLFDEIDLNHQQQHQQNHQTQHTSCSDPCVESTGLNQPQSPTLSRSSSISLSDVDDQVPNRSPQSHALPKISQQRKRKRQSKTKEQQQKNQKLEMTHKQYKHHGTTTFFDQLSLAGINWCRYCGTTEGVNWRPGPWGKRTLCNKHGCDYKGYGLANRLPRLDLSDYRHELLEDRHRPVVQEFCSICQERDGDVARQHSFKKRRYYQPQRKRINSDMEDSKRGDGVDDDHDGSNELIECDGGCSRAFHRQCSDIDKKDDIDSGAWMDQQKRTSLWFCGASCFENRKRKRVFVDLPRKQPLMRS